MANPALTSLRQIVAALSTRDEIDEAFAIVKERWSALQASAARAAARDFAPGSRVMFTGKRGQIVRGVVVKINTKSVSVKADGLYGPEWRVAPTLLSADDGKGAVYPRGGGR